MAQGRDFKREALPHDIPPYQQEAQGVSMHEFERMRPYPFLLYARSKLWDPKLLSTRSQGGSSGEETKMVTYDFVQGGYAFLSPIRKLQSDSATPEIYLGRATENDIVVPVPSVSSVHASFQPPVPGQELVWKVQDLGSRNGSWHNEEQMPRRIPRTIKDGEYLRLGGNLISWFLYPGRLWHLLNHPDELSKLTDL